MYYNSIKVMSFFNGNTIIIAVMLYRDGFYFSRVNQIQFKTIVNCNGNSNILWRILRLIHDDINYYYQNNIKYIYNIL